jgi:hypothetical protein
MVKIPCAFGVLRTNERKMAQRQKGRIEKIIPELQWL